MGATRRGVSALLPRENGEAVVCVPFLISFTLSSASASGSDARPSGSKLPPGYSGSAAGPLGKMAGMLLCSSPEARKRSRKKKAPTVMARLIGSGSVGTLPR